MLLVNEGSDSDFDSQRHIASAHAGGTSLRPASPAGLFVQLFLKYVYVLYISSSV
jgi:hypothetical protein